MSHFSYTTALAIVPDDSTWAQFNAIRAKHDKGDEHNVCPRVSG
jgi:hypothetical protein